MNRIVKYIIIDILRSKIVLFYTILLSVLSWSVFLLEDNAQKGVLTLLNLLLLNVPLFSIIFSTIYIYNSFEFIELLISQPIKRVKVWVSLFYGLNISLLIALLISVGIPLLIFSFNTAGLSIMISAVLISLIFSSLAFLCSIISRDKTKGIGLAILLWLFISFLFDGIIMFLMFQFGDYPIEKLIIVLTALNPIDLARISVLLQLDMTAMLGYTGALFRETFHTSIGVALTILSLVLWIIMPFMISVIKFKNKDH